MSLRPEGTDGSDYFYRETVEDLYKSMPTWRAAGWMALHFTAIPLILKIGWSMVPVYFLGAQMEYLPAILLVLYLLSLLCWTLAAPATAKESLLYIKLTNVLVICAAGLQATTMYHYHAVRPKDQLFPGRLWQHLQATQEGWSAGYWKDGFTVFEAVADSGLIIALGITAYCLHSYITRKMVLNKRLKAQKKSDGAAEPDASSGAKAASSKKPTRRAA